MGGVKGTLTSFDAAKERWVVRLDSGEGLKLFKDANLEFVLHPDTDSLRARLEAAVAADKEWSSQHGLWQRSAPRSHAGSVDPLMWHIDNNLCQGNKGLSQFVLKAMARMLQMPDRARELPLDDEARCDA